MTSVEEKFQYLRKTGKRLFESTFTVFRLLYTIPVTSASGERQFSKLKLVKNALRSTMSEDRLNQIMLLSMEKDFTDAIDLDKIVKRWASLPVKGRVLAV